MRRILSRDTNDATNSYVKLAMIQNDSNTDEIWRSRSLFCISIHFDELGLTVELNILSSYYCKLIINVSGETTESRR